MVVGFGFGVYYFAHAQWFKVCIQFLLVLTGASAALLIWRDHLLMATLVPSGFAFVIIVVVATFQDLPSAQVPRTSHQYLMVLGMGVMLLFRRGSRWLRFGLPAICLLTTLFFSSTQWGIRTSLSDGDELRAVGAWVHSSIAMSLVMALIYVMQSDLSQQQSIIRGMRRAVERNQFYMVYQAQVDTKGALVGAEALLRWRRPEQGMVPPADFIPVAESTGMIVPIGHWVLGTACAQLLAWSKRTETAHLILAVNVSAVQFKQADFVNGVVSVLQRSGAKAHLLKLELTESSLVNDMDDIISKMQQLQGYGIQLSLDDFGTGYSSLGYLQRLPIHEVKIDKSFVRNVVTNVQDATLVRSIVRLAHDLNLGVIAEGVETTEQHAFLQEIGCEKFQGYFFSRPLESGDFERLAMHWGETQQAPLLG